MRRTAAALLGAIILLLTACSPLRNAELPEPEPEPTPEASEPAELYFEEEAEVEAPSTIDELSQLIGMSIAAPSQPVEGMELKSLGYDGKNVGALKYQNGSNILLYTFHAGKGDPYEEGCETASSVEGYEVFFAEEGGKYSAAFWQKGGNTFMIYAEPAFSENDIKEAVKAMIKVYDTVPDSEDVLSELTLSKTVGFSVSLPAYLPDGYELKRMYAKNSETPLLIYEKGDMRLTFAKCEGAAYPERLVTLELPRTEDIAVGEIAALAYTAENGVCLAEWQQGGFGYSVTVTDLKGNPMDVKAEEMRLLAEGFMGIVRTEE